jgi:hypothetical protein
MAHRIWVADDQVMYVEHALPIRRLADVDAERARREGDRRGKRGDLKVTAGSQRNGDNSLVQLQLGLEDDGGNLETALYDGQEQKQDKASAADVRRP